MQKPGLILKGNITHGLTTAPSCTIVIAIHQLAGLMREGLVVLCMMDTKLSLVFTHK